MFNRVTLIGNLGNDPDIRTTQDGRKVCNLSVATNEKWKDKNTGEKKERVEWHRVTVWSQGLVGICEQYLKKGSKVLVEGKLETRKWQDQSGNDRWTTEIILNGFDAKLVMLDSQGSGGDRPPPADSPSHDYGAPGGQSNGADYGMHGESGEITKDLDDEIPF